MHPLKRWIGALPDDLEGFLEELFSFFGKKKVSEKYV